MLGILIHLFFFLLFVLSFSFFFLALVTKKAYLVVYIVHWFPFFEPTASLLCNLAFFVPTHLALQGEVVGFLVFKTYVLG